MKKFLKKSYLVLSTYKTKKVTIFLLKTEIHANKNAPSEMMRPHCAAHTGRTEDNRKASVKYCCVINPATFDSKGYAMMSTCRRQKMSKLFFVNHYLRNISIRNDQRY